MLWKTWMAAVLQLRPAFSRLRTFQWFVTALAAMSIRKDYAGVTSFIRSGNINPAYYTCLLNLYQSNAIDLIKLAQMWTSLALKLFAKNLFFIKGQIVLVGDGIKIAKEGLCMPAVKLLHQSSQSNSKAEWIMGHSLQALSLLAYFGANTIAVPLVCKIHEGLRTGPRDCKTLMDKFLQLLLELGVDAENGAYLVADAYYACGSLARKLMQKGVKLITRVRKNAVAYFPAGEYSGVGRPAKYGLKIKLWNLFSTLTEEMIVSVYSGAEEVVRYGVFDLMWKSYGDIVRFCLIDHPTRGKIILMSLDTSLTAMEILTAYSNRFKIEYSFKELVHVVGGFCYRFWIKGMKKTRRGDGDRYIHRESPEIKNKVEIKIFAYNLHIQMALIVQGLFQYLSTQYSDAVWSNFGSWLRTIRPGVPASVQVTQESLRNDLGNFRETLPKTLEWQKFAKSIWGTGPPCKKRFKNAA